MNNKITLKTIDFSLSEARNTLTYTLHLNYDPDRLKAIINENTSEDPIALMSKYMHEACLPLFCPTLYTKTDYLEHDGLRGGDWHFFGSSYPDTSTGQHAPGPLSCLDTSRYYRVWETMLTHHCLLATYDKLYNIIFHKIPIHGYHLSRLFSCYGFNYVLEDEKFHIKMQHNEFGVDELEKNTQNGVVDSNTASNYGRNSVPSSFKTIRTMLDRYANYHEIRDTIQLKSENKKSGKVIDVSIPMNMIPLFQQMRGRGKEFANIVKLYDSSLHPTPQHIKKFMESVDIIQKEPIKLIGYETEQHMTPADTLYYQYKLEQTFNFDLVYCISRNIISFDKRFNQRMCDDLTLIDIVTSAVAFPNTISRNLLVQMAFDCCTDSLQLDTSLLVKRVQSPDSVITINKRPKKLTDPHNFFNQWKTCYNNFVNYMTELVFPIYESYFWVMIYDAFSDPQKSTAENILKLYFELNNYLSKETVFKDMSNNFYMKEIMQLHNFDYGKGQKELNASDFIVPNYSDNNIDYSTLAKVALSTYNHIPKSTPTLISRDYLYGLFPRTRECLLNSCTSDLLIQ